MSENKLLDLLQSNGREYAAQMSQADLEAVRDNNPAGMSAAGLRILKAGKQDLGAGEFLDVGTSIAGAMSGAALGSMAGPVGSVVGGVIGGALGAFGGEVIEDKIAGREVNTGFSEGGAGREALISGGLDLVTLGLGKTVRLANGMRKAHLTGNELGKELAPALATVLAKRGSPEAAAQSSEILGKYGETISPMALQGAGMFTRIAHQLGEIGLFSGAKFSEDVAKREAVFFKELDVFTDKALTPALSKDELGASMWGVIETGRKASFTIYGLGLEELAATGGKQTWLNASPVAAKIDKYLKSQSIAVKADKGIRGKIEYKSGLSEPAQKVAAEMQDMISTGGATGKFRLDGLLRVEKTINKSIQDAMPASGTGNSVVLGELMDMHKVIREGVLESLEKVDPKLAGKYSKLQASYAKRSAALHPKINQEFIRRADSDSYNAIGSLLVSSPQPDKIKALLKSIKTGHLLESAVSKKNGIPYDHAKKTKESIDTIRTSFINELTGGLEEGNRRVTQGFVSKLSKPESQATMQAVFGEQWPAFKKLINLASDQIPVHGTGAFSLSFRSMELSKGVGGLAQLGAIVGASAATGSILAGGLAAAAIFTTPTILYKLATKPSNVNKIIALDAGVKRLIEKGDTVGANEYMVAGLGKLLSAQDEDTRSHIVDILGRNETTGN